MKYIFLKISLVIASLALQGCSIFIKDCTKLSGDRGAYRECTASQGNTKAQYELGVQAFEAKEYKNALKWLKLAATPNSGRMPIYMPPVGGQKYGTVMMMDSGQATQGHRAAQLLLAEIYEKGLGVDTDVQKANRYREMAGNNGY